VSELFIALRHFAILDHFVEETFIGFTGNEDWTVIDIFEHESTQAEVDTAFQFFSLAMAIETVRFEDGADVFFEDGGGSVGGRKT